MNDVISQDERLAVKCRNIQDNVFAASRILNLLPRGVCELTKMENDEK